MESNVGASQPEFRSGMCEIKPEDLRSGFPQILGMISRQHQPDAADSSFRALLELPSPRAVELLVNEDFPAKPPTPLFPPYATLIERASKFSLSASADNLLVTNSISPASSSMKLEAVKQEHLNSDPLLKSTSPAILNQIPKSAKRKDVELKVNGSNKRSRKVVTNEASEGGEEKLPYVHVRARRGQATDSHSLAERARREKINARMKLLQELVPGCSKISSTAMVLEEIINHVQLLQRQVEFLSMRLAAVNPSGDINLDALFVEAGEPTADDSYPSMFTPSICPEVQINESRQQLYQQSWHFDTFGQSIRGREEDISYCITPDNSMLASHSSPNSASLHSSQLKMEL